MKESRVTKTDKQLTFKGAWGNLEATYFLHRLSWTKYFMQAVVSMWNSAIGEKFNFYFLVFFASNENLFLNFLSLKS